MIYYMEERNLWKTKYSRQECRNRPEHSVLGIISIVCWFFGWSLIASVILGVVGLILSSNAKKAGFVGGMQTAGFVLSLIGLIGGGVFLISCIACVGAVGGVAGLADIANSLN